jgi:carboxyl-terminal processing protease
MIPPLQVRPKTLRRLLLGVSVPLVALVLAGSLGARVQETTDGTLRDLRVFSEITTLTSRNYVDPIDFSQLERGAYQGLAESLDPWSSYYDPDRMKPLLAGDRSADIGIVLMKLPQEYVRIVLVVPGGPADQAAVKRGQYIETIDGKQTKDLALVEAQAMLAGAPGTKVTLGFFKGADDEERHVVDVVRGDLSALRVVSKRLDGAEAQLRVTDLRPGAKDLVAKALQDLVQQGVTDLVLDLRENGGGDPAEAIAVADLFTGPGAAFESVSRQATTTLATKDDAAWAGKLVVLISRSTMGEAELLADALHRLRGAKLVGASTMGKHVQQDLVLLSSGQGLYMSVAEYRQPDGSEYPKDGLAPDEKVSKFAPPPETAAEVAKSDADAKRRKLPEGTQDLVIDKGTEGTPAVTVPILPPGRQPPTDVKPEVKPPAQPEVAPEDEDDDTGLDELEPEPVPRLGPDGKALPEPPQKDLQLEKALEILRAPAPAPTPAATAG